MAVQSLKTAPMVEGMLTSGILELLVLPAFYALWKGAGCTLCLGLRQELFTIAFIFCLSASARAFPRPQIA